MSNSLDFPISWQYPSTGPAPPTPVVVNTVPMYSGGRPTPPPTPPRLRATPAVDDYAPCPPTPCCVPSSVEEDALRWSDALNPRTSRLTSSGHSELDPLTALAFNDSADLDHYDVTPHVSDCLIYAREHYAFPSPVLIIIKRAKLDLGGRKTQPVNPWACGQPFKLFSLTAGNTPATGLKSHDEQSFDYYVMHGFASLPTEPGPYCFSIGTIQALQDNLPVRWRWVYPEPIPPIIIRSHDLVGPYHLNPRGDGFAFVMPTEGSIWSTICQRGVDEDFRPINPSATVETNICRMGAALYYPQHIVASKFAVNVFLEISDSDGLAPLCEYLGAYVLQVSYGLSLDRIIWANPEIQRSIFDRVPRLFEGPNYPSLGWPRIPNVHFFYYKWDPCFVGLADKFRIRRPRDESGHHPM